MKILIEFNDLSDVEDINNVVSILETLKYKYNFDWKDGRNKQDVIDDGIKKIGEELSRDEPRVE